MTTNPNLETDIAELKLAMTEITNRINQFNQDLADRENEDRLKCLVVDKEKFV